MASRGSPTPKRTSSVLLKQDESSQAHMPPHTPPRAPPQQASALATFEANFRNEDEHVKFKRSYGKRKIRGVCTIKMVDFVESKLNTWSGLMSSGGCYT